MKDLNRCTFFVCCSRSANRDDSYEEIGNYENLQDFRFRPEGNTASEDEEEEGMVHNVEAVIEAESRPGDLRRRVATPKGQCLTGEDFLLLKKSL
jgi:hypothetical protein